MVRFIDDHEQHIRVHKKRDFYIGFIVKKGRLRGTFECCPDVGDLNLSRGDLRKIADKCEEFVKR